jgi:chromosome segregation ATPase
MEKKREQTLPALILVYGGSDKKPWPLNRDVVTVGRAKGCDIVLEAPDVSSLHCLVWAFQGGYQVRDCGSRAGTQLNGDRITESILHDGDILQVGSFSFRLALPSPPRKEAGRREQHGKHMERSRRHLARLALAQRKKLHALQQDLLSDSGPAQLDLKQKASGLRRRYRDFEQRIRNLEQGERDLSKDRETFAQECKAQLARIKENEQELERRQKVVQAELEVRRQQLLNQEKVMAETQSETSAQREQAEKSLREQRAELVRMMADLRKMHDSIRSQKNADVQALLDENERLKIQLAHSPAGAAGEPSPKLRAEIKELQEENLRLRDLLQEQRELLEELKNAPAAAPPRDNVDLDNYEAELNRYQQQLEADRQKLDEERQQIKVRNQELDEATREMEMEFSRERAELARERTRLERLREEVRVETERLQRDSGVRESLISVHRLREGINQKR